MKKFLLRLTLFAVILVCIDRVGGMLLQTLTRSANSGDTARNEYIANEMDAECLFFGSSRCIDHYDPKIFEDSLGMTCYNCGQNGMGIILCYARYKMITERYVPKMIVYDPLVGFDLENGDNHSYLTWLRPYYDHLSVDSLFWSIDKSERWKMISKLYWYNGKMLQILTDNVTNMREEYKGYRPGYGVMAYEPQMKDEYVPYEVDSLKLYYMEEFIKDCKQKGTKLVFALSPFYKGSKHVDETYAPLIALAEKYNITWIDHFSEEDIVNDKQYFKDTFHMNRKGSEKYCKKLAHELKILK